MSDQVTGAMITAAPAMLAALKQARILIEAEGIAAPSTLAAINAAIAKAEGKS
jgi:hypothetical protein